MSAARPATASAGTRPTTCAGGSTRWPTWPRSTPGCPASASTRPAPRCGVPPTAATWCCRGWPSSRTCGPRAWTSSASPPWARSSRTPPPTGAPTANTTARGCPATRGDYASLAADRESLREASPLTRIDQLRAPLFIIHGANDPRVPLSEAEQIHAALTARGQECELLVYGDEGHGLAQRANREDAVPKAIAFLARHLAQ